MGLPADGDGVAAMAPDKKKLAAATFVLLAPFYAAYGAWWLVVGLVRIVRWGYWTVRLLRPRLRCPACNEINTLHGRWECRAPGCGAIYMGDADRCERCGAGASFFPCAHCGASILLRSGR